MVDGRQNENVVCPIWRANSVRFFSLFQQVILLFMMINNNRRLNSNGSLSPFTQCISLRSYVNKMVQNCVSHILFVRFRNEMKQIDKWILMSTV